MSGRGPLAEDSKQGLSGCLKTQGEQGEAPWRPEGEITLPPSGPDDAKDRAWPSLACLVRGPYLGVCHLFTTSLLNVHDYRETAVMRRSPSPPEACILGGEGTKTSKRVSSVASDPQRQVTVGLAQAQGSEGWPPCWSAGGQGQGRGRGGESRGAGPDRRGLDFVDCEKQSSLERKDGG